MDSAIISCIIIFFMYCAGAKEPLSGLKGMTLTFTEIGWDGSGAWIWIDLIHIPEYVWADTCSVVMGFCVVIIIVLFYIINKYKKKDY